MRVLSVVLALLVLAGLAAAQAPSSQPHGNLAQVMRGISFPSSNIIFDTQTNDPGAEKETSDPSAGALSAYASIYPGWTVVEDAALALAETANLIMIPGRLCENGRPVPVERADFVEFAQGLRDAGMAAYKTAQTRDLEKMAEVTDQVFEACLLCHEVYRDRDPWCVP